ncbi:phosphoribosylformylglycinamidine synthase I [bacterium]|jgi:phosphoribosylformylglycinamidine synthase subunit PurQ / glutaminase|nr:phosphoribosylformylglycinamidine synthase I [bacterium]MBT6832393.1 phosphoribosylformylglycinamidine synthase I [bacterium]MBT6995938.1 phosphoribosylformylglycinamidine synthase I [bacterium]MBT7772799.1 phosphoribosylformylglycinamidine synthase I [bacterium]
MKKPTAIVLGGYGINSETETIFALNAAGCDARYVHTRDLLDDPKILDKTQILVFPGGFSHGDHTGSGKALSNLIQNNLGDEVLKFVQRDTLTLGICNGFQVLVALGLVPALEKKYGERQAGLLKNKTNRFVCRYVHLKMVSQKCVWTRGIEKLYLPMSHGEGNFYLPDTQLDALEKNDQIVFQYIDAHGVLANGKFPANPNGAARDIAGICDPSGRILGLMPHPERGLFSTNLPEFGKMKELARRENFEVPEETTNRKVFENAAAYFA